MIYYPLSMLMLASIREILVITTPEERFCINACCATAPSGDLSLPMPCSLSPRGLADAILVGKEFLAGESACLILGYNIFFGQGLPQVLREAAAIKDGAVVFAYPVPRPRALWRGGV
jgi:glucose-1-phosphate thymidylyltransferase